MRGCAPESLLCVAPIPDLGPAPNGVIHELHLDVNLECNI